MKWKLGWTMLAVVPLLFLMACAMTCTATRVHLLAYLGDADAMYDLGDAYCSVGGKGIVDPRGGYGEAVYWFRKAARKGNVTAMYSLCQVGDVPNEERVMWLKKGAEMGSEACVIELMNAHRYGHFGLSKDKGAAIYWELKRGELYLKREKKSQEESRALLAQWEQRYRKENKYDGPVRPLP